MNKKINHELLNVSELPELYMLSKEIVAYSLQLLCSSEKINIGQSMINRIQLCLKNI